MGEARAKAARGRSANRIGSPDLYGVALPGPSFSSQASLANQEPSLDDVGVSAGNPAGSQAPEIPLRPMNRRCSSSEARVAIRPSVRGAREPAWPNETQLIQGWGLELAYRVPLHAER